jgi:ATP-binding cassette subfamily B protein
MIFFEKSERKIIFKFFRFLLPYWKSQLLIVILSGASVLLALVNPYLTKLIIDKAIMGKDINKFITLIFIGAGVFICNGLIKAFEDYLERNIKIKLVTDLTNKLFLVFERISLNWFQNKSSGEHVYKINYDLEMIANFIAAAPQQMIIALGGAVFICFVLFSLSWQVTILSLTIIPVLFLVQGLFNKKIRQILVFIVKGSEALSKRLTDIFFRMYFIKVFGTERFEINDYLNESKQIGIIYNINIVKKCFKIY